VSESADLSLTRRGFLRRACGGCAALAVLPWVQSCAGEEPFPGLVVDLEGIPEGRSFHLDEDLPVELLREGDRILARSLLCTHQGCQVRWREEQNDYLCPCHAGRFDATGHPVAGPPREPLRGYEVTSEGPKVYVHTRPGLEGS
jgi:Rieske Fe-S protein